MRSSRSRAPTTCVRSRTTSHSRSVCSPSSIARCTRTIEPEDQVPYIRYSRGSRSDPHRWSHDWNRSFELGPAEGAVGTALLLHGLTDSPYSMHALARIRLASRGYHVVGLRLPGHGTAPAGLLSFTVEDMRAAVGSQCAICGAAWAPISRSDRGLFERRGACGRLCAAQRCGSRRCRGRPAWC